MASDDSRPKVRMLFTIFIVGVSVITGIKFVLDSYYLRMTEGYEHTLLPPTTELDNTRAEAHVAIDQGPIPVSVAMKSLATLGRDNASPVITPQPSDDLDPLRGWSKLKRDINLPPQVTSATPSPPPPMMMMSDAGSPMNVMIGDAGVTTVKDGGVRIQAPQAPPKDGGR